jgi:hypothetical protein
MPGLAIKLNFSCAAELINRLCLAAYRALVTIVTDWGNIRPIMSYLSDVSDGSYIGASHAVTPTLDRQGALLQLLRDLLKVFPLLVQIINPKLKVRA